MMGSKTMGELVYWDVAAVGAVVERETRASKPSKQQLE